MKASRSLKGTVNLRDMPMMARTKPISSITPNHMPSALPSPASCSPLAPSRLGVLPVMK